MRTLEKHILEERGESLESLVTIDDRQAHELGALPVAEHITALRVRSGDGCYVVQIARYEDASMPTPFAPAELESVRLSVPMIARDLASVGQTMCALGEHIAFDPMRHSHQLEINLYEKGGDE